MKRAYAVLDVKSFDDDERVITGMATTPTPDRVGDIVEPLGVKFKNPLPLLHQHNSDEPVGTVKFGKPTKDGIPFEARLPKIDQPFSLKERIDTAWAEVKAKLVRGVSIGFRALEYAIMDNGGYRFLETEVLELSLVTIPANADATIQTIKSIDTAQQAATGQKHRGVVRLTPPGASGIQKPKRAPEEGKEVKKTIAEQISAFEATRVAKSAEMDAIMDEAAEKGETLDAEQKEKYDTLDAEVKEIRDHIVRLSAREKSLALEAKAVNTRIATEDEGSDARDNAKAVRPCIKAIGPAIPKGVGFVRLLAARYMAMKEHLPPAEIALSKGWGQDIANVLRTPTHLLIKGAVAAANTTDANNASALVTYQNLANEFIELLRANTIVDRLPGLRRVPFNIKVPRQTGKMTAYWVPQGSPKPVTAGAFDTVTLDFAKIAGITVQTEELLRFSQPNSETLLRDELSKAIVELMDNDFLDPSKAAVSGESPASMTNGVTPIAASGLTADAFRADFADLLAAYTAANLTLRGLVLIMGESQALRLSLMRNDFGAKEFPDVTLNGGFLEGIPVVTSEGVPANGGSPADGRIIVALSGSSVLLADDGGINVDISTEASLQMDSAPDSPATASTTMVSLWQTDRVGIRCERFVNWTKARTGAAQYISGANYG